MKWTKELRRAFKKKRFLRITRKISKNYEQISRGFLVDYSEQFIVLQESEEFRLTGFILFKIADISDIRYNVNDAYYDKIMKWEGEKIR